VTAAAADDDGLHDEHCWQKRGSVLMPDLHYCNLNLLYKSTTSCAINSCQSAATFGIASSSGRESDSCKQRHGKYQTFTCHLNFFVQEEHIKSKAYNKSATSWRCAACCTTNPTGEVWLCAFISVTLPCKHRHADRAIKTYTYS